MKKCLFLLAAAVCLLPIFSQNTAAQKLAEAAFSLTRQKVTYDPAYFKIDYPKGDVPADRGVCTDVVIRAYRKMGIDLQELVHNDMQRHFYLYPKKWGLKTTDTNIDHRRVPNLMVFFGRHGKVKNKIDFQPGDIVVWNIGNRVLHIGIVSNRKAPSGNWQIIHNVGGGQVIEDKLYSYTIVAHYAYAGGR